MNEAKKNELYDRYENSTHLLGRLGTAAAILLVAANAGAKSEAKRS